jgi:hypothetical protein
MGSEIEETKMESRQCFAFGYIDFHACTLEVIVHIMIVNSGSSTIFELRNRQSYDWGTLPERLQPVRKYRSVWQA